MTDRTQRERFERLILAHLDAAYELARWLTRNDHDAEDVVQEACLKAFRHFGGFRGDNPRAWLLAIVRNACFTWIGRNRPPQIVTTPPEAVTAAADRAAGLSALAGPESSVLAMDDGALAMRLLEELPAEFREVLVLREMQELSYREIADVTGVPEGTVMSRLARARARLRRLWQERTA